MMSLEIRVKSGNTRHYLQFLLLGVVKSNTDEILEYKSGVLLDNNTGEEIYDKIDKILSDESYKKDLHERAIKII